MVRSTARSAATRICRCSECQKTPGGYKEVGRETHRLHALRYPPAVDPPAGQHRQRTPLSPLPASQYSANAAPPDSPLGFGDFQGDGSEGSDFGYEEAASVYRDDGSDGFSQGLGYDDAQIDDPRLPSPDDADMEYWDSDNDEDEDEFEAIDPPEFTPPPELPLDRWIAPHPGAYPVLTLPSIDKHHDLTPAQRHIYTTVAFARSTGMPTRA
ncbi:hypothetical protein HD553DRAFT_345925 [Filobasidium floriforme]|uniref:uncharacterized protein n=1 Tax=Filobasidium floriforme TaxID=5210 RepID=UPI001E8CC8FB|nr:uncharacterized protein HD553DRAFT_345925 [Filobasidium floriforme]KAH8079055.1 hypothetical protein HD553DRAFT_345925 [Filobasidium floriforme]